MGGYIQAMIVQKTSSLGVPKFPTDQLNQPSYTI